MDYIKVGRIVCVFVSQFNVNTYIVVCSQNTCNWTWEMTTHIVLMFFFVTLQFTCTNIDYYNFVWTLNFWIWNA